MACRVVLAGHFNFVRWLKFPCWRIPWTRCCQRWRQVHVECRPDLCSHVTVWYCYCSWLSDNQDLPCPLFL